MWSCPPFQLHVDINRVCCHRSYVCVIMSMLRSMSLCKYGNTIEDKNKQSPFIPLYSWLHDCGLKFGDKSSEILTFPPPAAQTTGSFYHDLAALVQCTAVHLYRLLHVYTPPARAVPLPIYHRFFQTGNWYPGYLHRLMIFTIKWSARDHNK